MPTDFEFAAKLLAPVLAALIGAISKRYLEAKPKLIAYLVHASAIPLNDDENTTINTHSYVVRNAGKKVAQNVRLGHNFLPKGFQIYPPVSHTVLPGFNGADEILIPSLVPNEQISISYLYVPPLIHSGVNVYIKSDEGMAQIINVIPTPRPSKLVVGLLWTLVFVGASTIIYWGILYAVNTAAQSA